MSQHRGSILFALLLSAWQTASGTVLIHLKSGQRVDVPYHQKMPIKNQVATLLMPPEGSGLDPVVPKDSEVLDVRFHEQDVIIELQLSPSFLAQLTEPQLERISRLIDLNVDRWRDGHSRVHISARHQGKSVALSNFLPIEPVPDKADENKNRTKAPSRVTPYTGALNDKVLFISQAHGWIDYDDFREWSTQRGITHGIVEDFVNSEAMNQYLLDYLDLAGATVFTLRERDMNTDMLIVDEADPAYSETGDSNLFNDSGANGFANGQAPYAATNDPFRDNGGTDRIITTSTSETAFAQWDLDVPNDGYYHVYVSYSGVGNRPTDAKYTVRHGGIDTQFTVNQQVHRYVWNHLGRFYFTAQGDNHIRLSNQSAQAGTTVSADAVRLGGGMGDVIGHNNGTLSTHPRWEEGARTWVQYQGASSTVYASGDVSARSRFADWKHYSAEDSVYVSWHSNAATGSARGTNTYIYSSNPPNGTYDDTQAIAGSPELQSAIHDEIINDIRTAWDSQWQDRGLRSAYFGEVNPNHNDEMPSVLIELAFHDNATDADALRDPAFRKIAARAVYQGIVKYFAQRDGMPALLLPEPPEQLQVTSNHAQSITVAWQASPTDGDGLFGNPATSYVIYRSNNGRNFDNGTEVTGLSHTFNDLTAGQVQYIKVKAKNAGGLSLDTEVLGVRTPLGNNKVLVVNGFDRLNSGQLISENIADIGGFVDRMYLNQMNRYDYVVEHGDALNAAIVAFDSASNEAVEQGGVDLSNYVAALWILGEESSVGTTLSSTEQGLLNTYLNQGGQLFISGAEIAWDLDHLGSAADQSFYNNVLMTAYDSDDAGVYQTTGLAGSPYENMGPLIFDDGSHHSYQVEYPDELLPVGAAGHCMSYVGAGSACTYVDTGTYRVIHLGFPFETIVNQQARHDVMAATMDYFLIEVDDDLIFEDGFENQ